MDVDWIVLGIVIAYLIGIIGCVICVAWGVGYICENGIQSIVEVIWHGSPS